MIKSLMRVAVIGKGLFLSTDTIGVRRSPNPLVDQSISPESDLGARAWLDSLRKARPSV